MASVFKRGGKRAKGYWYASWFDHNGKRRTQCTRTTDKSAAERIARQHEADAALRRDGVIDPALDAISKESQRSIDAHLADYESKQSSHFKHISYFRQAHLFLVIVIKIYPPEPSRVSFHIDVVRSDVPVDLTHIMKVGHGIERIHDALQKLGETLVIVLFVIQLN